MDAAEEALEAARGERKRAEEKIADLQRASDAIRDAQRAAKDADLPPADAAAKAATDERKWEDLAKECIRVRDNPLLDGGIRTAALSELPNMESLAETLKGLSSFLAMANKNIAQAEELAAAEAEKARKAEQEEAEAKAQAAAAAAEAAAKAAAEAPANKPPDNTNTAGKKSQQQSATSSTQQGGGGGGAGAGGGAKRGLEEVGAGGDAKMGGVENNDIGDGDGSLGDLSAVTEEEAGTGGTKRRAKPNPTKEDILGL